MNDKGFTALIIILIVLSVGITVGGIGYQVADALWRRDAIHNNAGHYEPDKNGDAKFVWGPK